jgi:hypothetical protein
MDGRCSHRESISKSSNLGKYQYLKRQVYENGTLVQDEIKVNGLLEKGKALWINDSYWLVMP